jgi:low temperature requirement protein LtrA
MEYGGYKKKKLKRMMMMMVLMLFVILCICAVVVFSQFFILIGQIVNKNKNELLGNRQDLAQYNYNVGHRLTHMALILS